MCGGSNPVQDLVSSVSDSLASIDPGPAIGQGLAELDKGVNDTIPGGWGTLAAVAAAIMTMGASIPESEALFMAEDIANLSAQGLSQEAIAQNLAINYGLTAEQAAAAAGTAASGAADTFAETGSLLDNASSNSVLDNLSSTGFTPAEGSSFSIDPNSAYEAVTNAGSSGLDFADIVKDTPGFQTDANGNIVQTFDDGSTITLSPDKGTVISTTEAIEPIQIPGMVKDAAQSLAKQAANKLLSSATSNLAKGIGVKSGLSLLGGTVGGGTGADQNVSATTSADFANLTPDLIKGNPNFTLNDFVNTASNAPQTFTTPTNPALSSTQAYAPLSSAPLSSVPTQSFRAGGDVEGHNPTFFSPGGLASMENTYVKGEGDGTSDSVAAMLADGEFVIPADVVSKLGNGSNDAGAEVLDEFLSTIRAHAQKHDPKELPPDSKGPLAYLAEAKKKARV